MGLWNFYFIAKLYLAGTGQLRPLWWLNLLFGIALLAPWRNRTLRAVRNVVAALIAIALLYFEVGASLHTPRHLLEPVMRVVPLPMLYALVTLLVAYLIVSRWIRVTTFVLAALIVIPLWQGFSAFTAQAHSNVESANVCPPAAPVRAQPAANARGG